MKKKFGIMGIALVLAVVATLTFGSVALAADPTEVTVTFNGDNPDVTVTASAPAGVDRISALSQFTLTGDSSATGSITAQLVKGHFAEWASVDGGYTATDGDFESSFMAEAVLNGCSVWHSEHSIDAEGVTGSSLTVSGYANAADSGGNYNQYYMLGAGQQFNGEIGEAGSATISGERWHGNVGESWDKYATFSGEVTGSSTVQFTGSTDGTYWEKGYDAVGVTAMYLDLNGPGCLQGYDGIHGLGFGIDITDGDGSSISSIDGAIEVSGEPNRLLETNYPYTSMLAFDADGNFIDTEITHDTGWAIIQAFNADQLSGETYGDSISGIHQFESYPGYILP